MLDELLSLFVRLKSYIAVASDRKQSLLTFYNGPAEIVVITSSDSVKIYKKTTIRELTGVVDRVETGHLAHFEDRIDHHGGDRRDCKSCAKNYQGTESFNGELYGRVIAARRKLDREL